MTSFLIFADWDRLNTLRLIGKNEGINLTYFPSAKPCKRIAAAKIRLGQPKGTSSTQALYLSVRLKAAGVNHGAVSPLPNKTASLVLPGTPGWICP